MLHEHIELTRFHIELAFLKTIQTKAIYRKVERANIGNLDLQLKWNLSLPGTKAWTSSASI